MSELIAPHGGSLVNLHVVTAADRLALKRDAATLPAWDLNARQLCDLELLTNGAFSPLQGFMTRDDYKSVCRDMRLASGVLWPMPVTLDVSSEFAGRLGNGDNASRCAIRKASRWR